MKKNILLLLLCLGLSFSGLQAQDQRSFETKVADVLNTLPADNFISLQKTTEELVNLGPKVIDELIKLYDSITPEQKPKLEYAFSALGKYLSGSSTQVQQLFAQSITDYILAHPKSDLTIPLLEELALFIPESMVTQLGPLLQEPTLHMYVLDVVERYPNPEIGQQIVAQLNQMRTREKFKAYKLLGNPAFGQSKVGLDPSRANSYTELGQIILKNMAERGDLSFYDYFNDQSATLTEDVIMAEAIIVYAERLDQQAEKAKAIQLLTQVSSNENTLPGIQAICLKSLIRIDDSNAAQHLVKGLSSSEEVVAIAAAHGYQELNLNQVDQTISALNQSLPIAQANAIRILSRRAWSGTANLALSLMKSDARNVKREAIIAYGVSKGKSGQSEILQFLQSESDYKVLTAGITALKMATDPSNVAEVSSLLPSLDKGKQSLVIPVIGMRGNHQYFESMMTLAQSESDSLQASAIAAMGKLGADTDVTPMINFLQSMEGPNVENMQSALDQVIANSESKRWQGNLATALAQENNQRFIPFLTYLEEKEAISMAKQILKTGDSGALRLLLEKLKSWNRAELIPAIAATVESKSYRDLSIEALVATINGSEITTEKKLLYLDKYYHAYAKTSKEKASFIRAIGQHKSFYALLLLEPLFDETAENIQQALANSIMNIVMPSAQNNDGMTSSLALRLLEQAKTHLSGSEASYASESINTYLASVSESEEIPYESIFNGKDLTGWHGLVANPKVLPTLSAEELAKKTAEANEKMNQHWWVEQGEIRFKGDGQNIVTDKQYRNFEMIVDWKIGDKGDSGIYLRGSPQVQIWDISRTEVGAQVGSGGLYNNKKHPSTPSKVADMPIGDWNHMKIRMTGELVSVWLNGELVVDNVVLENYWDRSIPIYPTGPIELQAHGTDIAFRNIYVKEIPSGMDMLTEEEKAKGFKPLFNGYNLDGWVGNKTQYTAKDGMMVVDPKASGNAGNIYTEKEYDDFHLKFEFVLTPGANNGLGVHAPLTGNAAYEGKELQILDNTAGIYANLEPYQYHGSIYGIAPAKRGFLKPVGEWNEQEVIIDGNDYKVILNGTVILDVNIKDATRKGTLDGKKHPGLKRKSGHIGFLGHGSELKFRNLRIKEL